LPGMGHDAEAVLASPAAQPPRRLVSVLINDILDGATLPAALVLDDLHTITNPALLGALDYLLERSPEGFHVVAGARYEPGLALARLRTRGQLAE
ncbi:MAG: helix-turn-helix transcriptional regulator, partial [Dehalococcoidia bacterium]|nr:helix-turn-helix transcriptional regulator [Dehalococcoidia bacterium]